MLVVIFTETIIYLAAVILRELQGETGLAVAILQRLGEDVETSLKQLLFGTVRRSLRSQLTEEMKRYGYLVSYELKMLDRISLIEVCKLHKAIRHLFSYN